MHDKLRVTFRFQPKVFWRIQKAKSSGNDQPEQNDSTKVGS
jgi:hypothetical protein